jgi:hypothetical protein
MAPKVPRTSFNSSRLIRLLSELGTVDVADSKQSLAERLGLWLGWADAISLSTALNAAPSADASNGTPVLAGDAAKACARVRADLSRAIATDEVFTAGPVAPFPKPGAPAAEVPPGNDKADFSPYRRSYAAHQRAMESSIAPLRAQVRSALGRCSPALGRLAALDEVMDGVMASHERTLLAGVPSLLEKRFRHLRKAPPAAAANDDDGGGPATPDAWLAGYRRDMQGVLLAELDIRLQPVEGLIDALGQEITRQP